MSDILLTCARRLGNGEGASITHLGNWHGCWPVEEVVAWIATGKHTCFVTDGRHTWNVVATGAGNALAAPRKDELGDALNALPACPETEVSDPDRLWEAAQPSPAPSTTAPSCARAHRG